MCCSIDVPVHTANISFRVRNALIICCFAINRWNNKSISKLMYCLQSRTWVSSKLPRSTTSFTMTRLKNCQQKSMPFSEIRFLKHNHKAINKRNSLIVKDWICIYLLPSKWLLLFLFSVNIIKHWPSISEFKKLTNTFHVFPAFCMSKSWQTQVTSYTTLASKKRHYYIIENA